MKLFLNIIALGIFVTIVSCKKNNNAEGPYNDSIIGKWKIIEVYADPGDGSGKFRKTDSKKSLEITSDSIFVKNGNVCNININTQREEKSSYVILSNNTRQVLKADICSTDLNIKVEKGILTIYYSCIEGCGEKFVRID
jgi:hypothetical protein